MDEIFTEFPYYGYRKLYKQLRREGFSAGRDKVLQYMHVLGLEPLYPKKKKSLSLSNKRVYNIICVNSYNLLNVK